MIEMDDDLCHTTGGMSFGKPLTMETLAKLVGEVEYDIRYEINGMPIFREPGSRMNRADIEAALMEGRGYVMDRSPWGHGKAVIVLTKEGWDASKAKAEASGRSL